MAYQGETQPQYAQGQNVHKQDWNHDLMGCCTPVSTCCMGYWLPCFLIGETSSRMRDPTMQDHEMCNSDCMIFCALQSCTFGWIQIMMKRESMRERFGIEGSGMGDCCAAYWCPCCALVQQEKEAKSRIAAGPVTQAYQAPKNGMEMP